MPLRRFRPALLASALATSASALAQAGESARPPELGDVTWHRSLDEGLAISAKTQKPVLILFDEVPGCSTCVRYGQVVLRHPLVVEAAETLFVPVAIYNNLGGKDRAALDSFGEPTWNNPVVRIVDAKRRALAPRVAGAYETGPLVSAMMSALKAANRPVPGYLELLATETAAQSKKTERAAFAMYCFWNGEACLGGLDGVVSSRTGFLDGHEVVELELDPSLRPLTSLFAEAKEADCARRVYVQSEAALLAARAEWGSAVQLTKEAVRGSEKDDKYRLRHSPWRFVPMTELQATRVNAALANGGDPAPFVSPGQQELYREVQSRPDAGWRDALGQELVAAFADVRRRASR